MLNKYFNTRFIVVLALGGLLASFALYGCKSNQSQSAVQSDSASTQPSFALFGPPPTKSGVQLWSETCARCHNGRPPEEFSDAQWDVIVHHMRFRANLTGAESREIVKFLQASN
jgi:hypothetical protein